MAAHSESARMKSGVPQGAVPQDIAFQPLEMLGPEGVQAGIKKTGISVHH